MRAKWNSASGMSVFRLRLPFPVWLLAIPAKRQTSNAAAVVATARFFVPWAFGRGFFAGTIPERAHGIKRHAMATALFRRCAQRSSLFMLSFLFRNTALDQAEILFQALSEIIHHSGEPRHGLCAVGFWPWAFAWTGEPRVAYTKSHIPGVRLEAK